MSVPIKVKRGIYIDMGDNRIYSVEECVFIPT